MRSPVNLRLASHPINWLTILLMLIIAGTMGHLTLKLLGKEPATGDSDTPSNGQTSDQTA